MRNLYNQVESLVKNLKSLQIDANGYDVDIGCRMSI